MPTLSQTSFFLMVAICCLLFGCRTIVLEDNAERPAHHTNDGFQNPHIGPIEKSPFTFLKMKYFGDEPFADHEVEAHRIDEEIPNKDLITAPGDQPIITWIGHSTFLIQYRGINILTDPMFSTRASPVSFAGPKRLVSLPLSMAELPPIHYVVISHNHYDHLDLDSVQGLNQETQFLVPLKLKPWFLDAGVAAEKIFEFDWWQAQTFSGLRIVATPSQHWSARGLFDRNETLWAAWYMEIDDFDLWFAGDTGYNEIQFKEIGRRFAPIDVGLIPIGAYAPRWFMAEQHVDPEGAIKIHLDIGAKQSFGMHWGTFQLSAEPFLEPKEKLAAAGVKSKLKEDEFTVMALGQTVAVKHN